MIAQNKNGEAKDNGSASTLPNSRKVYASSKLHPEIKVPFREISLAPTKTMNGEIEANQPVRVYDTSGPWGDGDFAGDVEQGLPALRAKWLRDRSDVEECEGRKVQPNDDGYLSEKHAENSNGQNGEVGRDRRARRDFARKITSSHATLLCEERNHHARNGIYRRPRESRTRSEVRGQRSEVRRRKFRSIKHQTSNIKNCPQRSGPSAPRREFQCQHPR